MLIKKHSTLLVAELPKCKLKTKMSEASEEQVASSMDNSNKSSADMSNKMEAKVNEGNSSSSNSFKKKESKKTSNKRARSGSPIESQSVCSSLPSRRCYVANVPFDVKWSDLKALFRQEIGNVTYCQLFEDEEGRSRGCGLIEFADAVSAQKAIETMHRYHFRGRELVVKEDVDGERDFCGRLLTSMSKKDDKETRIIDRFLFKPMACFEAYNTYGLSVEFLESLGITGTSFD